VINIIYDGGIKKAVIEARRWDKDYVYVYNAYIHPSFRSIKNLKKIIKDTAFKFKKELGDFKYIYFKRKKYQDRLSKSHSITRLVKGVSDVE